MDIATPRLTLALELARRKAKRYAALGLYLTAQFHAEKATLFADAAPRSPTLQRPPQPAPDNDHVSDELAFARTTFAAGQHKRALLFLAARKLPQAEPEARILAAQCHFVMDDFEAGLAALGDMDASTDVPLVVTHPPHKPGQSYSRNPSINLNHHTQPSGDHPMHDDGQQPPSQPTQPEVAAALAVLRATAYEELGSMQKAVDSCKAALCSDIHCYEAMQRLVDNGMALPRQLTDFVEQLRKEYPDAEQNWIFRFYEALVESSRAGGSSASSLAATNTETIASALSNLRTQWPLARSVDVLELEARVFYADRDYRNTCSVAEAAMKQDPLNSQVLLLYLSALFELGKKQHLFSMGHQLVREKPDNAISWLAVGYYYLLCSKFDAARRYLQKATTLNGRLASAWLAYGHTFAAQDESDQSMAAYRTASRLFPGSHLPLVYIGAEYARQSSFVHADRFFRHACDMAPRDPIPLHELGVVAFRSGEFQQAIELFESALTLCKPMRPDESTLFNLGHAYRRIGQLDAARRCYEKSLSIRPRQPSTLTALGMVQHLQGQLEASAATYHTALRLAPEDSIAQTLLEQCLLELMPLSLRI